MGAEIFERYPALYELVNVITQEYRHFVEIRESRYLYSGIKISVDNIPTGIIRGLSKPESTEEKTLNISIPSEDLKYAHLLKILLPYALEVCYDKNGNIIYVVVDNPTLPPATYLFISSKRLFKEYYSELEEALISTITKHFSNYILGSIYHQHNVKVDVRIERVEVNDRILQIYRNLFVKKLNDIVKKYAQVIEDIRERTFKNALRLLQSKKIVKILKNGVDVAVDIKPRFILYEGKRYEFVDPKYVYSYVRIRVYTDSNMRVTGAKVVWWDENKRGKLIHPQISLYDKDVCLGELKRKDIYYVIENLENMLCTWNLDSPYEDVLEYLYKVYDIPEDVDDKKRALLDKLVSKKATIWEVDEASWC